MELVERGIESGLRLRRIGMGLRLLMRLCGGGLSGEKGLLWDDN